MRARTSRFFIGLVVLVQACYSSVLRGGGGSPDGSVGSVDSGLVDTSMPLDANRPLDVGRPFDAGVPFDVVRPVDTPRPPDVFMRDCRAPAPTLAFITPMVRFGELPPVPSWGRLAGGVYSLSSSDYYTNDPASFARARSGVLLVEHDGGRVFLRYSGNLDGQVFSVIAEVTEVEGAPARPRAFRVLCTTGLAATWGIPDGFDVLALGAYGYTTTGPAEITVTVPGVFVDRLSPL